MRCIIRDVILVENFDKWSDWSAIDTAGKELTREEKKIIIKFSNNNSKQGFISNTLNVRQACVRKFLKWWKCWQSVEKVASNWQTTESDWRNDWRIIRHVEAHRKKDIDWNYKLCIWCADSTIITTYGTTSFAFLRFNQTKNLEANCNKQGELTTPCVLVYTEAELEGR